MGPLYGPIRNIRLSLCWWLKKGFVALLMLALRLFGFEKSWVSLGFLLKPQLFFTMTIKVQSRSLIILFHIVRWSILNFISTIWDNWFRKRSSLLFIIKQVIKLMIFLWILFRKWSLKRGGVLQNGRVLVADSKIQKGVVICGDVL